MTEAPTYAEREAESIRAFAVSVWKDPGASEADRQAAKERLTRADRDLRLLTNAELTVASAIMARACGEEPDEKGQELAHAAAEYLGQLIGRLDRAGQIRTTCPLCEAPLPEPALPPLQARPAE